MMKHDEDDYNDDVGDLTHCIFVVVVVGFDLWPGERYRILFSVFLFLIECDF